MEVVDYILSSFSQFLLIDEERIDQLGMTVLFPKFSIEILHELLDHITLLLSKQPNLLFLTGEFTIVGDIHGNIRDLLRIFCRVPEGYPPNQRYIFLGDYVDRGEFSTEVIVFLYALMAKYPDHVYLLRGNHEFPSINSKYGFKNELTLEYGSEELWEKFNKSFSFMSIAAIVNSKYFLVHGGISEKLSTFHVLSELPKPVDSFENGLITDLVWADPTKFTPYYTDGHRGYGNLFGEHAIIDFLFKNDFIAVIRAHECVDGIASAWNGKCITVFSTSGYAQNTPNSAGFLQITPDCDISFRLLCPLSKKLLRADCSFYLCSKSQKKHIDWPFLALNQAHTLQKHKIVTQSKRMSAISARQAAKPVQHKPNQTISPIALKNSILPVLNPTKSKEN